MALFSNMTRVKTPRIFQGFFDNICFITINLLIVWGVRVLLLLKVGLPLTRSSINKIHICIGTIEVFYGFFTNIYFLVLGFLTPSGTVGSLLSFRLSMILFTHTLTVFTRPGITDS